MNSDQNKIAILVIYNGQRYGLFIPVSYTIRQIKKEINVCLYTFYNSYTHLGIKVENQVLSFNSIILENNRSIANYGISSANELLLIENAFQDNLVNKDVDLVELGSWLDFLTTDYENASKFTRDVDYILSKLRENEHKPYALETIDNAIQYVKKCSERSLKLQELAELLSQKYSYLTTECTRFYQVLSDSKDKQLEIAQVMGELHLRPTSDSDIKTVRITNKIDTPQSSIPAPSVPRQQARNAIEGYLWSLNERTADVNTNKTETEDEDLPSQAFFCIPTTPVTRSPSRVHIVRMSDNGEVIRDGKQTTEDDDGEEERIQREEIMKALTEQISLRRRYIAITQRFSRMGNLMKSRDRPGALALLGDIESNPHIYVNLSVLDLSYCSIGSEGFMMIVNLFMNNSKISIKELHLAGNMIGANQIIYLINQLHIDLLRKNIPNQETITEYIFHEINFLNLNDNPLGNEGVRQLFRIISNNTWPKLKQLMLMNTEMTTEVTSMLINVNLHENNHINIVIPETQMAQMTETERDMMLHLYDRIDKRTAITAEIDQRVSDLFVLLFMHTLVSSLDNVLQKITIKDVNLTGNCFTVFVSTLHRYISYGRCKKLTCLSISRCKINDTQVPMLCDLIRDFVEYGVSGFSYLCLDENSISGAGLKQLIKTVSFCRENGMNVDFSINHNPIGNSGLTSYLQSYFMPYLKTLDTLNLSGCSLSDSGLNQLLRTLEAIRQKGGKALLRAINLSENKLTDKSIDILTSIFGFLPDLRNIYIENTNLSSNGIYGVINHFIKNKPKSFLYICMRYNNVDEVERANLGEVIQANFKHDDNIVIELS